MYDHVVNMLCFAGSEEIVDYQVEVNRLLKKTMDEISVENRGKEASWESSTEAVLKELGIQLPEGKIVPGMIMSRELVNRRKWSWHKINTKNIKCVIKLAVGIPKGQ